jgi:phage protein D
MSGRQDNKAYKFTATVGGREFTQSEQGGLEHMLIEDHVDLVGVARFTFNLDHGSWSSIQIGSDVEVKVGSNQRKMFVGVVTGMRHAYKQGRETMTVVAMDPLIKASASRRTETYEKMTDSDIVQQVIGKAGMTPGTVDATTEVNDYVIQRNEGDLEFMKRLAARNGYLLMVKEGKVDFVKPQYAAAPAEIKPEQIEDLDYQMSANQVPPGITSHGWDYNAVEKVEGSAGSGDVVAIGGGKNAVEAAAMIWKDKAFITEVTSHTQTSAKDTAVSELNRAARNFLRGTARVDGNGDIFAGGRVKFTGHPKGFNADVYVISARHVFEFKRGYITEFSFCSNTMPV